MARFLSDLTGWTAPFAAQPFLDLRPILGDQLVVTTRATGLRSFAFHPDFARKGAPGRGKLYTVTTETVASLKQIEELARKMRQLLQTPGA